MPKKKAVLVFFTLLLVVLLVAGCCEGSECGDTGDNNVQQVDSPIGGSGANGPLQVEPGKEAEFQQFNNQLNGTPIP